MVLLRNRGLDGLTVSGEFKDRGPLLHRTIAEWSHGDDPTPGRLLSLQTLGLTKGCSGE